MTQMQNTRKQDKNNNNKRHMMEKQTMGKQSRWGTGKSPINFPNPDSKQ